jgi:predicted metal-dependent peptidase
MSFDKLTPQQKIQKANIDCMRHPKFALLSGIICMGKSEVRDDVPTAGTNGKDKYYGTKFISDFTLKQLRYLVLHENFHVALKHCVLPMYRDLDKKFGAQINNVAMDFCINGLIEELDPDFKFVERPTKVPPLVDAKFKGMSYIQILQALLKDAEAVYLQPMDSHDKGDGNGGVEIDGVPKDEIAKQIDDANRQGEMLVRKMAGNGQGGRDILETAKERQTDWREALREFIQTISTGDENSRFCPPNKRMLASGFVMPSHFTESMGELTIACDTSGSMHPYYGLIFGEIAKICKDVNPEGVRVLWWDTSVCGDQEFKPHEYDSIANLMSPSGGGGTTPTCVTEYIEEKKLKPTALLWLSDGYLYCDDPAVPCPSLWGIVDNTDFVPRHGKVVRIQS